MKRILWNNTGALGQDKATPLVKIAYPYGKEKNHPKVYTLTYDGFVLRVRVNGVESSSMERPEGGVGDIGEIVLGADFDNSAFLKGLLPEVVVFNNSLSNTDRAAYENYLADKWLPNGTVLNGHTVVTTATKPTLTSGAAFLEFNEEGLVFDGARVTQWTDNSVLGGQRVALPNSSSLLPTTQLLKGRNALYFDNKGFFRIADNTDVENNPDLITIMFVCKFDDYYKNTLGDTDQSIFCAKNNTKFRIKKYDEDSYISFRLVNWDGYNMSIRAHSELIFPYFISNDVLGYVSYYSGTDPNNLTLVNTKEVNNVMHYGISKWPMTGLTPNTKYYGKFKFSRKADGTTDPHFDFINASTDYEFYKNCLEARKETEYNLYQTVRSNEPIPLASGLYYFEIILNRLDSNSVAWIGLGDTSISHTIGVGLAGWVVNSNGRRFAKQTGGGDNWGDAPAKFVQGDRVGILYNSDAGSMTMYKNGILVGTPIVSGINTPVNAMIAVDKTGYMEGVFEKANWTNPNALPTWKTLPYITEVIDEDTAFEFKTLPPVGPASFKIVGGSCNLTGSETEVWAKIVEENPDLFVHMGDLHYENVDSKIGHKYAEALDLTFKSNGLKALLRKVPWEYKYDNHDSTKSTPDKHVESWPYFMDFFMKAHNYQPIMSTDPINEGIYGSFKMGRCLIITTDLRRNRDTQRGPMEGKSMLGAPQKAWLKDLLLASKTDPTIDYVLWISSVLWTADRYNPLGDSLGSWGASWASYEDERAELANYIYNNQIKNIFFLCGDTHMQAIDDGRNSCFITDLAGNRIDAKFIEKDYWMPMLEASPFEQDPEPEGGPFATSDVEYSGGPIISYSKSYGVIEVLDRGENWVQIKLYTKALAGSNWIINRYHTFNFNVSGTEGIAPPFEYPREDGTIVNMNGYIQGDPQTWNPIQQRFIGTGNEFRPQLYKFKFIDGEWKKIYDANAGNPNAAIVPFQLNGWSAEKLTWLRLDGDGFLSSGYPLKFGAFYELKGAFNDLFENFGNAQQPESITPHFVAREGINCYHLENPNEYFYLPDTVNSGIFWNDMGIRDYFFGVWFYIPEEAFAVNNTQSWIMSDIDHTIGLRLVRRDALGNAGDVYFELNLGSTARLDATLLTKVKKGWNKLAFNFKRYEDESYSFYKLNGTKFMLPTGFIIPDMGSPEINAIKIYINKMQTGTTLVDYPQLANLFLSPRYISDNQINIWETKPIADIILTNKETGVRYTIPDEWRFGLKQDTTSFTLPDDVPEGDYNLTMGNMAVESVPLPLQIVGPRYTTEEYKTNFNSKQDFNDHFYVFHKGWGGANGGVVKENVILKPGKLELWGNGDLYTGDIQGVNRDGKPLFHTHEQDPKLGQPWKTRVGACAVFNKRTGFGSYRVKCTIPTELGMCSAFWTFFYNEIYPSDPRYASYLAEGLHPQGNLEDGFYVTRNHEIDIEFPSHLDGGILYEPSFNNMKCNTWRGELQNWDVPMTDPAYWEEYRDNLTPTGLNIYDGQEREYRFDWYADRVEFYIDGVLKKVNVNTNKGETIPDIAGHFTFGVWFPSARHPTKPWLANPTKAWAGGVLDTDGGRKAMWDRAVMEVSEFHFIPFDQTGLRTVAETYPFGPYRTDG